MAGVLLVDHFRWVLMCLFFRVTDRNPGCFKVHLPRHLTWGKHSFPPPPNPTFLFPPLPQEFWSKQVVFTCLLQTNTASPPIWCSYSMFTTDSCYQPVLSSSSVPCPAGAPTPLHTHALLQKTDALPPWVCLPSPCFHLKECTREAESTLSWLCPSEELTVILPQS